MAPEHDLNLPMVSVCVQTYQHAPYIKDALDGILMQKTDFSFEILIGEDGSTDGNREICIDYAKRYPDKIRLFLNTRDKVIYVKGRPTGRWNLMNNLKNARGKYIALLPGDDYWTDPLKLQKQFDVLEQNDHVVACHHWYTTLYEDGIPAQGASRQGYCAKTITTVQDIFANRVRIKARTIMFRNVIDENFFPDWFLKVKYGDVPLSFLLGKYGDFYFIDEPMAVYRITGKGLSMTGNEKMVIPSEIIEHYRNWIEIWRYANKYYNYRYWLDANKTIFNFYSIMIARILKNIGKYAVLSLKKISNSERIR
jgi:glycosyltransferase involved in cell wall biosynthesis